MKTPIALLALLIAGTAHADDDAFRWSLTPYLWITSLSGEQKTHDSGDNIERPIDIDMGTAVSGFEFGFLGHLEARKNNWGWFLDTAYVALELESHVGPIKIDDIGFNGVETELAGVYRPGGADSPYDIFAGIRYWDLSIDVPITGNFSYTQDASWTDFMVGARYFNALSADWRLALRGDLASASDGSELTVNVEAMARNELSKSSAFLFGWRYMDVKFEEGDADDVNDASYYELHVTFNGPIIAYQFNW